MDGLPDNVRHILENEGIRQLTAITSGPLVTSPQWGTPESLYRLSKPNLVGIVRSLGLRNVQRLRKFSLVNIIWLDMDSSVTAETFSWLDNSAWQLRDYDMLRYVLLWIFRNALPPGQIPMLNETYSFTARTDFRRVEPRKLKFMFALQYHFVLKNFAGNSVQLRMMCMEAFAHVRSLGHLPSPSARPRSLPRARRPVERRAPRERIPPHIVEEYTVMYTNSTAKETVKECPICLDVIEGADLRITNCGHCFHTDCLSRITRDFCPTCRARGPL